ncbi:MAG: intracellular growth attenuator family protein [Anaerolineae bacterium]|nr:intracellular growth attenuator family protein [Anaerolineae bacterium]
MGLFAIVINAFLFWLLSLITPAAFIVNNPQLFWLAFGGTLMGVVVMVMEAFLDWIGQNSAAKLRHNFIGAG